MSDEYENLYRRQLDIFNPEKYTDTDIAIVGVGGIGSILAIALVKNGFEYFRLYDKDKVEEHNISNQFYRRDQEGMLKVEACAENMEMYAPMPNRLAISTHNRFIEKGDNLDADLLITAVDSMEARNDIFKAMRNVKYLIDARFGGIFMQIYCADFRKKEELELYKKTLTNVATPLACTGRAVAFCGFAVAGQVGAFACWMLSGQPYPTHYFWDMRNVIGETNKYLFSPREVKK